MSENQDGSIWAYVENNSIYIISHNEIYFPENSAGMFYVYTDINMLECNRVVLNNVNTSNVTNMHSMFEELYADEYIGLENMDVSNVTDMSYTFSYGAGGTTLDLSSWDTSKVTDMEHMFSGCYDLCTIYVGDDWSVNSVTKSDAMFQACENLFGAERWSEDNENDKTYADYETGYLTYKAA
ncbi:MAG: BspA family leucine-rich repeat surface protein [Clostridia bacterium]|nr:BspA family leucine-rich repeat surface protein [Clostridia bacterium]